jgi:hypothetical protein
MTSRHIFRAALCAVFLPFSGCVTKDRLTSDLTFETDEQSSDRRIFKDDWIRPSVTKEDYDFFYKGWFKPRP